jgi:hypothetical protein
MDMSAGSSRRLAGAAAAGGSVIFMAGNLIHPRPASFEGNALISLIASSDIWMPIHLVATIGLLGMLGGLVLFTLGLSSERARVVGALAATAAVVGGAVAVMNFGVIDGIAMRAVAVAWANAPAAEQPVALRIAMSLEELDFASVEIGFALFFGLAFLLTGIATILEGRAAFGWAAAICGAAVLVAAVVPAFAGVTEALVTPVIGLSVVLTSWEFVLGLGLLRSAKRHRDTTSVIGAPAG